MEVTKLEKYRASIDNLDAALVHVLAERFRVTREVGLLKQREGIPPADPERERVQLNRLKEIALGAGLDPAVVEAVFPLIMAEVRRRHSSL